MFLQKVLILFGNGSIRSIDILVTLQFFLFLNIKNTVLCWSFLYQIIIIFDLISLLRDNNFITLYYRLLKSWFLGLLPINSLLIEYLIGFDIQKKILLEYLNTQIFLVARNDSAIFTYFIIEKIDPLDSLELILY